MKAMILQEIGPMTGRSEPLELVELPTPEPGPGEVRLRVLACGVCHTELDEIEGRAAPPRLPIILGHQVVGEVDQLGIGVTKHAMGDRLGVGWIYASTGARDENLSPEFQATGKDANGGYAEYMIVPENYAYPIPEVFSPSQAAPLLCAGAVGYRALNLCRLKDGDRLGLTGFGGSAHLVLQLVRHCYPNSECYVFARHALEREFALSLGAHWAGDTADKAPEVLHAIIDTTPAWKPVVCALNSLAPGGRLVINAIRKEQADQDELLKLSYHEQLWMEREIKTVANVTHFDLKEFLPLAASVPLRPEVSCYPLSAANEALHELKSGNIKGAKVLMMD